MHNACKSAQMPLYRDFKTINHLNPEFMHNIFETRVSQRPSGRPNDLKHYRPNQTSFGSNGLKFIRPQIWNSLPEDIKSAENLVQFKRLKKLGWSRLQMQCMPSLIFRFTRHTMILKVYIFYLFVI